MINPGQSVTWIIAGIISSAVGSLFATADGALAAIPAAHLQSLSEQPGVVGDAFRRYVQNRHVVLSRWLVGRIIAISVAAVLYSRVAESVFVATSIGASPALETVAAVLCAVSTYGTLSAGLLNAARRRPEVLGTLALRFLRPLELVLVPLADPLAAFGRFIGNRFEKKKSEIDARRAETEVQWVVMEGERTGAIANEPAEMIRNVLEFKDLTAREVMVPRRRISAIEVSTSLERVVALVAADGHSRYPVYRETLDNVVGLLYAKDLFAVVKEKKVHTTKLSDIARSPVLFVIETQSILSMLREMRARRLHMAIVSDEFGGTSGLVTLEDIIEEIVGEIHDEYDTETQIQELGEGRLVADAAVPLADLSARLGRNIPADGEFESLGGLIVHRAGRVPEVGATLTVDGLKLIVREADKTRVVKVEIVPIEMSARPAASAPPS
ncbi:hemolysin family protein [Pendulispora albinea]|uniref:Hemolysin family protein n=1 Tax=Pendulispora albinea TaxID=2741071 RepID=A0ABZ2M601_9BACT